MMLMEQLFLTDPVVILLQNLSEMRVLMARIKNLEQVPYSWMEIKAGQR